MMLAALLIARIGSPLLGIVIPAVVFLISFVLTGLLYRHFSRTPRVGGKDDHS